MPWHDEIGDNQNHRIYDLSYANAAARDADTTWNGDSANLGKTVLVTSDDTVFMLLTTTPTWFEFGGSLSSAVTIYNTDDDISANRQVTAPLGRSLKLQSYDTADASTHTLGSDVDISNGEVDIEASVGDGAGGTTAISRLLINTATMQFLDQINESGPVVAADYSDNWTDLNLVHRGWVVAAIIAAAGSHTGIAFAVSSNTAALGRVSTYMCTSTAAARTLTISSADIASASVAAPWTFEVLDTSGAAGTNSITIDTEGSEKINGTASIDISVNYGSIVLVCDGSNLFIRSSS